MQSWKMTHLKEETGLGSYAAQPFAQDAGEGVLSFLLVRPSSEGVCWSGDTKAPQYDKNTESREDEALPHKMGIYPHVSILRP